MANRGRLFAQMLVKVGVLGEAGLVDHILRLADIVAFDIDLHEVGRGHFVIEQAEGIDEEGIRLSGHRNRDMVVNALAPAEMFENAIAGGKILADFPFFLAAFEFGLHLRSHGAFS